VKSAKREMETTKMPKPPSPQPGRMTEQMKR
jgi:hypothetical protein